MLKLISQLLIIIIPYSISFSQIVHPTSIDSICSHLVQRDSSGRILSWYKPEIPGAGYDHVVKLASEFIKSGTPVEPSTGKKLYFITCCFQGPHIRSQKDFDEGNCWEGWMHNPACVFAGMVQSLVLDYRVYSGDNGYLNVVREMVTVQPLKKNLRKYIFY